MALDVPHDKALRGLPAMESLVRAVVAAGASDETECDEWKGLVDLSTKADCFLVAKAILGLANRDPARAARFFEGYGYVVAGAEPGNLHGVGTDDPADYATRVKRPRRRCRRPSVDPGVRGRRRCRCARGDG
jgi:hypothetical protein